MRYGAAIALALAVVGVGVLESGVSWAACGSFAQITTNDAGNRSFLWTEGVFDLNGPVYYYPGYAPYAYNVPITNSFRGSFWRLTSGDPEIGLGDDNGAFDWINDAVNGGVYYYNPGAWAYAAQIFTGWGADAAIDGCVGSGGSCTTVLLADQDGVTGSFAVVAAAAGGTLNTILTQPGTDGAGNAGPIILLPLPTPQLTKSQVGIVTVSSPTGYTSSLYLKDGCSNVVTGYNVYQQTLPAGSPAPSDRDPASGWNFAAGPIPIANPVDISLTCGSVADDAYVAVSLVFDSGFETPYLSPNAQATPPCCEDVDVDGDGFTQCGGDCDDINEQVFPGAPEVCDQVGNDCDDPTWPSTIPEDTDDDGDGFAECEGDCDDAIADVYPQAPELCDRLNNDCDEPTWPTPLPIDADDDGDGLSECEGDCDDTTALCITDCPDGDGDGYCSLGDCDDSVPTCTTDCITDNDGDSIPDCADPCIDVDRDGSCAGTDCDDSDAACTTDCSLCPVCDLDLSPVGCVTVLDPSLSKELFWGPGYPPDQLWTVNVTLGTGYVASAGAGVDAAGNLYTLDPPNVVRYSGGTREVIASIDPNLSRGLAIDVTNGKLLLGIWDGGSTMASIVAIAGLPRLFDIMQTFEPVSGGFSFKVPAIPEGLEKAERFDTYYGSLDNLGKWNKARPLQCAYPASPPVAGDLLTVTNTVPNPGPGEGIFFVTAVTYLGETRFGRKASNGVLSGRDPTSLRPCN